MHQGNLTFLAATGLFSVLVPLGPSAWGGRNKVFGYRTLALLSPKLASAGPFHTIEICDLWHFYVSTVFARGVVSLVVGRKFLVANDCRDGRQLRKSGCVVFYAVPFEGFRFMMVMGWFAFQLWFCWKDRSRWDMEIATDV